MKIKAAGRKLAFALALLGAGWACMAADGAMSASADDDGGTVQIKGKGKITIMDCNGCLGRELRTALTDKLANMLLVNVEPVETGTFRMNTAGYMLAGTGGNAGVFFVEDPGFPISLVAMEERWGLVNVYWLQEKIVRASPEGAKVFNSRVRKEFARVIAALLGPPNARATSQKPLPVRNWRELDENGTEIIPFEALMAMFNYMPQIGIERVVLMTYREACEAGVAPEPSTDVQRRIAQEVRKAKPAK